MMQNLRVVGVESGSLVLASTDGDRYRVTIDDNLRSAVRPSAPDPGSARKLSPREIQAHIRSGMSAGDVASITGASLEYIERFEGPVLAEREHVIQSALNVPVHTAMDTDPLAEGQTFGNAILARLAAIGATNERWASWKETGTGWVVKLSFTAELIDHDARWSFEPRKSTLAPINNEAITLSQQGELSGSLIPRLRAVGADDRTPDSSRFDSGAFHDADLENVDTKPHPVPPTPLAKSGPGSVSPYAINSDEPQPPSAQTADLLDALRRRRGEREAAVFDDFDSAMSDHPSTGGIRIVDVPLDDFGGESAAAPPPQSPQQLHSKSSRKGRASMPSWDEIVFGARPDDDPA